jgi:hypothetical protein
VADRAFADAALALAAAGATGSSLCLPILDALPVTHAAISTLGAPFGSETVCASDRLAARLDELQIDFGAGPCWDALRTRAPVIDADLDQASDTGWPWLRNALRETGIRALYAFPLAIGAVGVGALDLYAPTAAPLDPPLIARASALAEAATAHVVRQMVRTLPVADHGGDDAGVYSRREVHQATGMIIAQMRVNPQDALVLLQAHAFAAGRPVREIAADVVARRIVFTPNDGADRG